MNHDSMSHTSTDVGVEHGMGGMVSTFSVNTKVTLLFADWVTETPVQYAFTLIFLFMLGLFNRFLAAIRSQLERRWNENLNAELNWASYDKETHKINGDLTRSHENSIEELEPLSPLPIGITTEVKEKRSSHVRWKLWVAYSAWNGKRDTVRAFFEFTRAIIGYILYVSCRNTFGESLTQSTGCLR